MVTTSAINAAESTVCHNGIDIASNKHNTPAPQSYHYHGLYCIANRFTIARQVSCFVEPSGIGWLRQPNEGYRAIPEYAGCTLLAIK